MRERIIRVVQKLPTTPVIPQDARDRARTADQLLEAEAILGGTAGASSQRAAAELTQAIRIAPWWPEATFKLASVLQKLGRVEDAVINLNLYKLADPPGFAATAAAKTAASAPTPAAAPRPAAAAPAVPVVKIGTGTVFVYLFRASGARVKVDCDGNRIAELQNGRIVTFRAPAGRHTIRVHQDVLEVAVEPGGEYYFKGTIGAFSFKAAPVPAAEAKAEIKDRDLKPNDAERVTSTECKAPPHAPVRKR